MGLHPYLFCLSFYLLYFVLPPFEDNRLPFWVPDVLWQHSEVVLWNLVSIQMFFWWICGGESGLHILFLRHLRTALIVIYLIYNSMYKSREGNGIPLQYFAWKIPGMEEPGRLQSMWLLRVGHDWVTSLSLFTFMHWRRKWQPRDRGAWWAAVYGVA